MTIIRHTSEDPVLRPETDASRGGLGVFGYIKRFRDWVDGLMQSIFLRTTLRLAMLFLSTSAVVIILLAIIVDLEVAYYLDRIQMGWLGTDVEAVEHEVLHQAQHTRILNQAGEDFHVTLIQTMLAIFVAAGIVNYFFAKWILSPIRESMWARKRFTMDAAHDLRTPIAIMTSMQETALRKTDLSREQTRELIESNLEELSRMSELTEDLLALSRIDNKSSKKAFTPVKFSDVVENAIQQLNDLALKKGVVMGMTESHSAQVMGDWGMLHRMAANILKNSITYTSKGGTISVSLRSHAGKLVCHFSDTGSGISNEHLPHIFDRFYKVDGSRSNRSSSGSGLGLAIVQEVVKKHGGTVRIESELGRGTVVVITLPSLGRM